MELKYFVKLPDDGILVEIKSDNTISEMQNLVGAQVSKR